MKRLEEEQLDKIEGGTNTITGPIISAVTKVIELIRDAGKSFGSGIRRISENELCPLK